VREAFRHSENAEKSGLFQDRFDAKKDEQSQSWVHIFNVYPTSNRPRQRELDEAVTSVTPAIGVVITGVTLKAKHSFDLRHRDASDAKF
jgi:hypothetical protein